MAGVGNAAEQNAEQNERGERESAGISEAVQKLREECARDIKER